MRARYLGKKGTIGRSASTFVELDPPYAYLNPSVLLREVSRLPKLRPQVADGIAEEPGAPSQGTPESKQTHPAIFPAPSSSLEPELWQEVESGFRRVGSGPSLEGVRKLSAALLKEPQIPRAPTVPKLPVPPARYPVANRPPSSPEDDVPTDPPANVPRSNRRSRRRARPRPESWAVQAARITFAGAIAIALAWLSGLF